MSRERLLERFLKYVQIDTTAGVPGAKYPSSDGQLVLGKLLAEEMQAMGISDAQQDEFGIVYGTVPGSVTDCPVVALNSHVDTSPETTGANVKPQVISNYAGGDIALPGDATRVITLQENPELKDLHGCTLITTDGTTLLGGDDKAGVAVIMEVAQRILEGKGPAATGPLKILFTCDEEIGHGVDHVDLAKLGADVCYTLDGPGANELNAETFSADGATVTIRGINIHPSIAKGRMVNALRAASIFIALLPSDRMSPETTEEREGFIHPVTISGGVGEATIQLILRSFETEELTTQAETLRDIAQRVEAKFPGCSVTVAITPQYRNLRDGLDKEPRAVPIAEKAHEALGRTVKKSVIRGGTDGSQLTALGLPTPNLSTGQHNPHSPLEWACLDEMEQAVELLLKMLELWSQEKKST
ncbi:peptidase T [Bremerella cremea]|uniref:peptidase T n=1 Tax=Bremerella cremea TaxID=1031537 RepID=UPI0031EC303C